MHLRSFSLLLLLTLASVGCAPRAVVAPPLVVATPTGAPLAADPTPDAVLVAQPVATQPIGGLLPTPTLAEEAAGLVVQPTATLAVVPVAAATQESPRPEAPPRWRVALDGAPPALAATLPQMDGFGLAAEGDEGEIRLYVGSDNLVGRWVYAAVAPLYTALDDTSLAALQSRWRAEQPALAVSPETLAALTAVWGPAGPGIQIVPAETLAARLWQADDVWGVVPFEALEPQFKVLTVEGQNPLRHSFAPEAYPLALPLSATGDAEAIIALRLGWRGGNRDPDKLTRVAITGVTALVRATAYAMETNGILWPGEEIAPIMQAADIAHISNEVSFVPDCPYPNPIGGTSFCSDARYMELLTSLGTDVIELTGNHLSDYGAEYLSSTIDIYQQAGIATYGGGRNAEEAAQPFTRTLNGNQIAFVGCNSFGPAFAWATADTPGARACDGAIFDQIAQLRAEGYIVFATLQYTEDYVYAPWAQQISDFRAYVDAGAHVVSGSQGHHLQGFDLYGGSIIHYGPGNLFFDQMFSDGTRQAFIDEYVIYDRRLIGLEITTGLIEEYARPRIMTPAERAATLETVFGVSLPPSD